MTFLIPLTVSFVSDLDTNNEYILIPVRDKRVWLCRIVPFYERIVSFLNIDYKW